MTDKTAMGWRLSQEQLGFLEELLSEAILEKAESRLRASLETAQQELKESLLEEFVELHDGAAANEGAGGIDEEALVERLTERLPPIDEEALAARLRDSVGKVDEEALMTRLRALVDHRTRDILDTVRPASGSAPAGGPNTLPSDVVLADDLRTLESWVQDQLNELKEASLPKPDPEREDGARSVGFSPVRMAGAGVGLFLVAAVAGWAGMASRIDSALEQRQQALVELSQLAQGTAEEMKNRADASEALFRDINAAASEIRDAANTEAVRSGLVSDLTRDAGFVAATTGPQGPRGPVGMPERVGLAPGRFSFQNTSGATVAVMGQDETGRGHAQIYGQSGAEVAYLGTDNGTEGSVRVRDTSGASEVTVKAGRESSSVAISTTRGQEAFIRTNNGRSAEMGVTNQSGDGGVVLRSQGGFGAISINGMSVHDFAEVFELVSRSGVAPGTVMSIAGPKGRLGPSTWAYDPSVIGVVSGAGGLRPGLTIGTRDDGSNDLPVAMSGQVFVRVNGEGGPIQVGDLLVASTVSGVAMRGGDVTRLPGAVIGKAMGEVSQFPEGETLIRMFVMAR